MAQTLRDWYRYLERQMHVSLPEPATSLDAGPPDALAAVRRQISAVLPADPGPAAQAKGAPATMKLQPPPSPVAVSAAVGARGASGWTVGEAGGGQAPRAAL